MYPSVCINAEPHGTALVSQKSSSAIAAMSFFVRRKRGRSSRTVVMSFLLPVKPLKVPQNMG